MRVQHIGYRIRGFYRLFRQILRRNEMTDIPEMVYLRA